MTGFALPPPFDHSSVLVAVAFVGWFLVEKICGMFLYTVSQTYRTGKDASGKRMWRTKATSVVNAVFGAIAAWMILVDSSKWEPMETLYSSAPIYSVTMRIMVGYFLYDSCMMAMDKQKNLSFFVHHLGVGGGMMVSLYFNFASFVFLSLMFNEITTPVLHLSWFLTEMGMSNTKLFMRNGILLFVMFIVFRVFFNLLIAYHWYFTAVWDVMPLPSSNHPLSLKVVAIGFQILYFVHIGLNIWWTYLIFLKGMRAVKRQKAQRKD
eukprot:CAMPEP_0114549216 /NCGR_PEP_ID=MMETSP0114-20121206/5409_1 /TAXON_ID=31324 /ORGANISM="Goniomonas sp, Strain m" /LENGTH=264 /DNA_ID=CAMNT_0001733883 /DNA_START=12 /DNA_END=806 /DNA_ORIENTATION=+